MSRSSRGGEPQGSVPVRPVVFSAPDLPFCMLPCSHSCSSALPPSAPVFLPCISTPHQAADEAQHRHIGVDGQAQLTLQCSLAGSLALGQCVDGVIGVAITLQARRKYQGA